MVKTSIRNHDGLVQRITQTAGPEVILKRKTEPTTNFIKSYASGRFPALLPRLATSIAVGILFLVLPTLATAQLEDFNDLLGGKKGGTVPKPKFTTKLKLATSTSAPKPGDEVSLSIHVALPNGYYIYGTDGNFGGKTTIALKPTGLTSVGEEWTPDREPKRNFEPVFKAEISKFYDEVTWTRKFRIADNASPGDVRITGELSGQYCSDGKDGDGQCVPIIPAYEFDVSLASDSTSPVETQSAPVRFDYEATPKSRSKPPERLRFQLTPDNAGPGETVTLSITIDLDEGWHTFSLTQNGDGGSKTEIDASELVGLKAKGTGFVADHPFETQKTDEGSTLEVHHGKVTWSQEFEVLEGIAPGQYGAAGEIHYQICKGDCRPRKLKFALGHVSSKSEPAEATPTTKTNPPADDNNIQKAPNPAAVKRPQDQGLFAFLLTAVGFGFVSLLTPCVFPMVPITVSFFLKQSESQHNRPMVMALVFCGSIVATFTILGVGIAAIFGAAQLNALANNGWLNIAIGTVFVAFGLNMLGLFEIRIPSEWLTFTSSKEAAGGYVGAAFMALTFTLTSFTCTFAFAGTLLVAAAQGQYFWPILGMMAFGTAFATPFFILALMPSMLKKLPKSGGWMNSVKVVMGMIELGAAVKFFSVADLAWNNVPMIFDFVGVMVAWITLSLLICLYLLDTYRLTHDTPTHGVSIPRLLFAMAFLGLSVILAVGILAPERGGGWVMDQIIAFAPPRFEEPTAHAVAPTNGGLPEPTITHHGIQFTMDVDKAIALAKERQQPMLFDFTGVNCINCRLMEKKLAQPQIRQRLDKLILVQLYADKVPLIPNPQEAKRILTRNVALQTEWFGDVTLPSYAVVTPDGNTILSSYFGLEQKDGEFSAFLDEGWNKWETSKK